jgi:hypothetical protein
MWCIKMTKIGVINNSKYQFCLKVFFFQSWRKLIKKIIIGNWLCATKSIVWNISFGLTGTCRFLFIRHVCKLYKTLYATKPPWSKHNMERCMQQRRRLDLKLIFFILLSLIYFYILKTFWKNLNFFIFFASN